MPVRRLLLAIASGLTVAAIASAVGCGKTGPGPVDTGAVALRTWQGFYVAPTDRIPRADVENPGTPWGDWLGSGACKSCHASEWEKWRLSFHSKTLYKATRKTVFGDFSGRQTYSSDEHPARAFPIEAGDRFAMRIERNPAATGAYDTYGGGVALPPPGTYEVLYAFGNRRDQPYVGRAKDGRHWVMPVVWDDRKKAFAWDGWRPYVKDCAGCHATGIRSTETPGTTLDVIGNTWGRRWNVAPENEGWADGAVGCENCHGPGKRHVEAVARMGAEAYRAHLAGGGAPTIYNPRNDTGRRRMQQCDACHTFITESPVSWSPGPKGYDRDPAYEPLSREMEVSDGKTSRTVFNDANYYEDFSEKTGCTVGLVYRRSKMAAKAVECRDCHDPHGAPRWAELVGPNDRNQLCLRCHESNESGHFKDDAAVAAHTRHQIGGPGSLCVECHMPRDKSFTSGVREHGVVQFMSTHMHSHAMSIPTGHEADKGGPPSACNLCHADKDAAWAQKALRAWEPLRPSAPR